MQFIGIKRLNSQLIRLSPFQAKAYAAMKRKENAYRTRAKATVQRVVYNTRPSPLYPRSGNLLAATDVHNIKSPDANITYIFLNPEKASRKFAYKYRGPSGPVDPQGLLSYYALTGQGGYRFYPSYVRRGIIFKRAMPKRDFVAGWRDDLIPIYITDMSIAMRKF